MCVCVFYQMVNLDPVIEDDEELQKSSKLLPVHTLRLGVELDSFDGHHYISSVAPGGPVDRHGVLRPEDELLEVRLQAESHRQLHCLSDRTIKVALCWTSDKLQLCDCEM